MNRINITQTTTSEPLINQDVQEYWFENQLYTGTVYEDHAGKIDVEFEVENGLKNGKETEFSEQNSIAAVNYYVNGLLDGKSVRYFENGLVQEEAFFEKGVCIESTEFDKHGEVANINKLTEKSPEYQWLMYLRGKGSV